MAMRGIRGATTAKENSREAILLATKELLVEMLEQNQVNIDDVASVFFSATEDLTAEFPAVAAREIGWVETPLLCLREINVSGSLQNCIRVLMQVNTEKQQNQMNHVYLHGAKNLRR